MSRFHFLRFDKNVHLLFLLQALANTVTSLVVTTTALAAQTIAEDKTLVTLPFALQFLSMMASTTPASLLMRRIGRRNGFTIATLVLMGAGLLAAYSLSIRSFPLYCLAGVLLGSFNAFAMYYRFTAGEVASEEMRSKAISYVMAGGTVAALCGPKLAIWARDLLAPVTFAGSFIVVAVIGVLSFVVLRFVEVPALNAAERRDSGRPLAEIARQPAFIVALLGGTIGYFAMNVVMTSTPLAMVACGLSFGDSAFVIQWHVLGMYAPAFVMGHFIQKFGVLRVMSVGVVLMFICLGINLAGASLAHFWPALFLLGVGWSCLFIGATTLLGYAYKPAERAKVQAVNDTSVFALVTIGAFSSGAIQSHFGWTAVNLAILPGLVIVAIAIVWLRLRPRPLAA
ncbi:MAG TPA: MFS transporter [Alphaproteobacteria bacterium]|nr:MFS transporter [Alphaproteobacteria bacterium]